MLYLLLQADLPRLIFRLRRTVMRFQNAWYTAILMGWYIMS